MTWSRFAEMRSSFFTTTFDDAGHFAGGDEVNDLHIFKLMSTESYILSCYEVAVEKSQDDKEGDIFCCKGTDNIDPKSQRKHSCPADERFKPNMHCSNHVECNDPIFRCFDMAKMAMTYAYKVPEYREEYEDIAQACRTLSVQLLDKCANTEEVGIVLKESAGSSKYFRYSRYMMYPRLRLAIEHNHKEFVGHMYCQQTLRQEWHGNVSWQAAPTIFKMIHLIYISFMAPFLAWFALMKQIGRDLQETYDIAPISRSDNKDAVWWKKWFHHFINFSVQKTHLDVPLNRFLIFTAWYIVYVGFVLDTILDDSLYALGKKDVNFSKKYAILSIFASAMLWEDVYTFITVRSITTYFKFWRFYDLVMHLSLAGSVICRAIRVRACVQDEDPGCHFNKESRDRLDDAEGVFLAMTATLSLNRLMYWLQLNERVGPIVINMARILNDILTIASTYVLVCLAFSAGLIFILSTESYTNNVARLNSTGAEINYTAYVHNFGDVMYLLFWTVLDPGPNEEDINNEGPRGVFATILFLIYQIAVIIVLLNLLIAVMNSTVQKFQDRRQLYWKFARTSVWIDFFDDHTSLQVPFSILNIAWALVLFLIWLCTWLYKRFDPQWKSSNSLDMEMTCKMKPEMKEARKTHALLMMQLISRLKDSLSSKDDSQAEELERFKNAIVKHLDSLALK